MRISPVIRKRLVRHENIPAAFCSSPCPCLLSTNRTDKTLTFLLLTWWWFMMIDDDLWRLMMIDDAWWWLMMIDDDWWWLMMIYDDWWCFMMIDDDLWWLMMIYDDLWWLMMIYDGQFDVFCWPIGRSCPGMRSRCWSSAATAPTAPIPSSWTTQVSLYRQPMGGEPSTPSLLQLGHLALYLWKSLSSSWNGGNAFDRLSRWRSRLTLSRWWP